MNAYIVEGLDHQPIYVSPSLHHLSSSSYTSCKGQSQMFLQLSVDFAWDDIAHLSEIGTFDLPEDQTMKK